MLPRVIVHVAVSVDGHTDGFTPDLGLYYGLAAQWQEDATLAGSETLLVAHPAEDSPQASAPEAVPVPDDKRPLLVVPDSRGRVRSWAALRAAGYWRDGIALCTRRTSSDHLEYLKRQRVTPLTIGEDQVDLRAALAHLYAHHAVRIVRVDSGGILNGVLLRAGLVNEISLLVHPIAVGGANPRFSFRAPDLPTAANAAKLTLISADRMGDGLLWMRYEVAQ